MVAAADPLHDGFLNPTESAKPHTWWHWMNGNVSREGITADLEAMKQIGLGGATIVNVDCDIPRGPVPFMSPQWREDVKFAASECDRLDLKLCIENCAGWSSSGGPWNMPENAMQQLTSSQTRTDGPSVFDAMLPQPATKLDYYRDIAVLAFQTAPVGTASPEVKLTRAVFQAVDSNASADVTGTIAAMIRDNRNSILVGSAALGIDPAPFQVKQLKLEFTIDGKPDSLIADEEATLILPRTAAQLAESRLVASRTFVKPPNLADTDADGAVIPRDGVVDLSAQTSADGRLKWNVPPGHWVIVRFGYTPIGTPNHPAPAEGKGLECDKMSKTALDAHWAGCMQKVLDDIGPLAGRSLDSSLIDSYEVGGQDWTANFREEFKRRRGYDPVPYLPTFTGRVVGSPAITGRFLWDMRRTVADLFAENYYGHFSELCHARGITSAIEPYTGPYESLQCGAAADLVMGEFCSNGEWAPVIKMPASVAHIYGKTIVGAESFTAINQGARWLDDPWSLKPLGDLMFCQGLNQCTFHRYAMQPWTNRAPRMTMGGFGLNFERTLTWWTQGRSWIEYITRCQFLLQQGRPVQDVAYFTGETAPSVMRMGRPALPAGYDYDAVNADVVLHGATVKAGRIVLASGASYAVLVLPPNDSNITPATLECIARLIRAGATVVGPPPTNSPSLADFPACDKQVTATASELWGNCDGVHVQQNDVGKGHVIQGKSLSEVLTAQNLKPDFEVQSPGTEGRLVYAHRQTGGADIYFVSNQRQQATSTRCTFRVSGKVPELWHPDTGATEIAPVWREDIGRTTMQLHLDPAGSAFVIFRSISGQSDHVVDIAHSPTTLTIEHAEYAAIDGAGSLDVTRHLAELSRDGQLQLKVDNDDLGVADPSPGHRKELRVSYTLDGKSGHITTAENDSLTLPAMGATSPPTSIALSDDGLPMVTMWTDGPFELRTANGHTLRGVADGVRPPLPITGDWKLSFPPNLGAPPSVILPNLISWTDHANDGVKYFSGTATYEKQLQFTKDQLATGRQVWLDLGAVKNFAEVSLNDRPLGVLWKPPFLVNLTVAAKPGANALVVKVTNLWPNRLIGDEQLPPDCEWKGGKLTGWPQWLLDGKPSPTGRVAFATWHHWKSDSPLLPSGMLGPVVIRNAQTIPAK